MTGVVILIYLQRDIRLDLEARYEARVSAMAKQIDERVELLVMRRTADLLKDFGIYGGLLGKGVGAERNNPGLINWAISPTGLAHFEESKRARDKLETEAAITARQADLKREQGAQTAMLNEITARLTTTQSQNAQLQTYLDGLRRQNSPNAVARGAR